MIKKGGLFSGRRIMKMCREHLPLLLTLSRKLLILNHAK
jgi:hypothetical protein